MCFKWIANEFLVALVTQEELVMTGAVTLDHLGKPVLDG